MSASPFILCENLVKIYKVDELEVVALQGLDLAIGEGEFLAIVGASGSGKTSLLNMLGGLDRPSAGRITVAGENLLKYSDKELARYRLEQVGFVWQQSSRNLIPYLSALENVELPMLVAGTKTVGNDLDVESNSDVSDHAQELLDAVELADRTDHKLAQLSGGQQQRVAIAVALANRPRLLLADEPTGEVDSATARQIWRVLRNLNEQYGLTTVIVSHDRDIAHFVDRVIHIRDGKTSSETVRQRQQLPGANEAGPSLQEPDQTDYFEERTVLDSAGRLQLPRDYLIQRNIDTRAIVQLVEEGILIRTAGEQMATERSSIRKMPANLKDGAEQVTGSTTPSTRWPRWVPFWGKRDEHPARPSSTAATTLPKATPGQIRIPETDSLLNRGLPLVETVNLSRTYVVGNERVRALHNINLTIQQREFVIFRGRSGSGKTTLLNLIGGLDWPTAGRVTLLGQQLDTLTDTALTQLRQEQIGFVFQAFSLLPTFSALENVEMLLRAAQVDEETRYARAMYCLTLVGLRPWADHRPFEMSGGQQQRLSIARALAHHPALLIADEPTSDLDSETGIQMLQLFQRLMEDEGVTILMSSHDPMSTEYASQVYELQDGHIVM